MSKPCANDLQKDTKLANELLWKFEAFREYISYDVLQPAASVLSLFEDEYISETNPRIKKLEKLLTVRTGKDKWKPNRSGTPDLLWNAEGDFTRNANHESKRIH
jgi:hypothetical protein